MDNLHTAASESIETGKNSNWNNIIRNSDSSFPNTILIHIDYYRYASLVQRDRKNEIVDLLNYKFEFAWDGIGTMSFIAS